MSELKPCPFCGGTKICTEKGINLNNYCDNCSAESNVEHWNTRPIEDALTARIAELETDNDALKTENAELKERIGFLEINAIVYGSGQMANIASIAELEAFVDKLIEVGEMIAECSEYESARIEWDALVDNRKEREE